MAVNYMGVQSTMRTVIETAVFQRAAADIWGDDERHEFIDWIASNPEVGDVIQGTGGLPTSMLKQWKEAIDG